MKKRSIILYWLLMLIPAVAICLAAVKLLVHEQERISRLAQASRLERAGAIAETLRITIATVEHELRQALHDIPGNRLEETLLEWEARNPLIRNVFIWDEVAGLKYPWPGLSATAEERRFLDRFDGLFSGRIPWVSDDGDDAAVRRDGPAMVADASAYQPLPGPGQPEKGFLSEKTKSSRQELLDLARSKKPAPAVWDAEPALPTGGWIPWFVENRLYILGWVKTAVDGPVYGVELELMTLLSRLITDFPSEETEGAVYALKDDGGRILHQIGRDRIDRQRAPESIVSLAPELPHWELAVYPGKEAAALSGRGFLLLSGLLLAIFLAAILFGGGMLTWQANRDYKDARQKTSFVSNVSHELKTPLTSIRMYAELLFTERVTDPDKKRHYLQVIVSETRRLTRLVNNVLDFSRLEQGRKKYHPEALDLTACLQEILASQALPVKEAGLALETVLPDRDVVVLADRDAIDQVMVNLIDNAVKYAASGGELKISLGTKDDLALIQVADKGPGVPADHRERIFDQFHRVDNALTAKQQGTGLGLSIARRISRDLGGDIIFRPGEDGGSRFIVSLPLYDGPDISPQG